MYEYLVKELIANANFKIADASEDIVNVIYDDTTAHNDELTDNLLNCLESHSIQTIQYTGHTEYTIDDVEGNFIIAIYNLTYINA